MPTRERTRRRRASPVERARRRTNLGAVSFAQKLCGERRCRCEKENEWKSGRKRAGEGVSQSEGERVANGGSTSRQMSVRRFPLLLLLLPPSLPLPLPPAPKPLTPPRLRSAPVNRTTSASSRRYTQPPALSVRSSPPARRYSGLIKWASRYSQPASAVCPLLQIKQWNFCRRRRGRLVHSEPLGLLRTGERRYSGRDASIEAPTKIAPTPI